MSRIYKLKQGPKDYKIILDKLTQLEERTREIQSDPMYNRKNNEHEWELLQINNERSRYVYELYKKRTISRELYEYCIKYSIIDGRLIAKWKKSGYEHLCCLKCIQSKPGSHSVCICRVPKDERDDDSFVRCSCCGCTGCCSTDKVENEDEHTEKASEKEVEKEPEKSEND